MLVNSQLQGLPALSLQLQRSRAMALFAEPERAPNASEALLTSEPVAAHAGEGRAKKALAFSCNMVLVNRRASDAE